MTQPNKLDLRWANLLFTLLGQDFPAPITLNEWQIALINRWLSKYLGHEYRFSLSRQRE